MKKNNVWQCVVQWKDTDTIEENVLITNHNKPPKGYGKSDITIYGINVPDYYLVNDQNFRIIDFSPINL